VSEKSFGQKIQIERQRETIGIGSYLWIYSLCEGYFFTRGSYFQAIFLMPLPISTLWGMSYFNRHYASKFCLMM
jgi:hypothetical protein